MQFVFPSSQTTRYEFPTHINDLVVDRADSETSEVFLVVIKPGKGPPLHRHDDMEQVFYVLNGRGTLSIGARRKKFPVRAGDVIRIPPWTLHSIRCDGKKILRYLAVDCFVDGRPKKEPTWDSHARVVCEERGWNYAEVKKF